MTTRQDYGTPPEFIEAVERRFGPLVHDIAADETNRKCPGYYNEAIDAFTQDWRAFGAGNRWLNPPFKRIDPWAKKAAAESSHDRRVFMLTPASIGTEWFAEHVCGKALVIGLRPRITFVGEKDPFPKDLMLTVFGEFPGFATWRWR